jgi:hypothetical protein
MEVEREKEGLQERGRERRRRWWRRFIDKPRKRYNN